MEHENNYGYCHGRKIDVRFDVELLDKMENKTINITINNYRLNHGLSKIIKTSRGRYKSIKPTKLTVSMNGKTYRNVIKTYMKHETR